jgi:hypothetical protein
MRLTRLRAELRSQRHGIAIGAVALLVAVGAPAQALEGATSAVNSVAKALKIAKKADKRSKRALRLAKEVSKAPGPRGPQGPAGGDAQFIGTPAGGGLAGTYPNPTIAQNAIGTAQITDDTLSGSDILEGSLGQVPSALAATNAQNIADDSVTASSFGTITKRTGTVVVPGGGTAENGNYDTNFKEVLCLNDEMAVAGGVDWVGVGGTDDQELWLSEFYWLYDATTGQPSGLHVTAGNDTGTEVTLMVEVACLAP